MLQTYIGIKLPDKAREVVVLEISGQQHRAEGVEFPDHKTVAR